MSANYPRGASIPLTVGEYGYFSTDIHRSCNGQMLHYWNAKTTSSNSAICHFSHYSPNLNIPGVMCRGRILCVTNELSYY
jgi:hypothetical protein